MPVWGKVYFNSDGVMGALALAAADRYAPPNIAIEIGIAGDDEFESFERHGFALEKAPELCCD